VTVTCSAPPPHGPGHGQRRGGVLVIVADLYRRQPHSQGMQLHRGLQGQAAEESNPDAAAVWVLGELLVRQLLAEPLLQLGEHLGGPSSCKAATSGRWASSTSASDATLASKASCVGGPSLVPAANRFCTFQVRNRNSATPYPTTRASDSHR
jgi:hypothetical protein